MILIGALVLFLLFVGLGFVSHVLWLGTVVVLIVAALHMVRAGLRTDTPTGRFNLRLVTAFRDLLGDVIAARARSGKADLSEVEIDPVAGDGVPANSVMTPGKLDIARRLADEGMSKSEIGRRLGVSRSTVSRYLADERKRTSGRGRSSRTGRGRTTKRSKVA